MSQSYSSSDIGRSLSQLFSDNLCSCCSKQSTTDLSCWDWWWCKTGLLQEKYKYYKLSQTVLSEGEWNCRIETIYNLRYFHGLTVYLVCPGNMWRWVFWLRWFSDSCETPCDKEMRSSVLTPCLALSNRSHKFSPATNIQQK